ncbi:MAG: hypothetical protein WCE48_02140 [Steroidobacteraceae bacterium]
MLSHFSSYAIGDPQDFDHDGVFDSVKGTTDGCPGTAANAQVNLHGCSTAQLRGLLEALRLQVVGVGAGTSVQDKVKPAQTYYAAGNLGATCIKLTDFVNEVKAQLGKKQISAALANQLVASAQAIMTLMGCS